MLTNGEAAVIAVVLHDTDAHAAPADAEERLHSFSALFLLLNKSAHGSELFPFSAACYREQSGLNEWGMSVPGDGV